MKERNDNYEKEFPTNILIPITNSPNQIMDDQLLTLGEGLYQRVAFLTSS